MFEYNEQRFTLLLKVTAIVVKLIYLLSVLGLVLGAIGFGVVLWIDPARLTFVLSDLPLATIRIDEFFVNLEEFFGDQSIALKTPVLLVGLSMAIGSLVALASIRQLNLILNDVRAKLPFSPANTKRFFTLSYITILSAFVSPILASLIRYSVVTQFDITSRFRFVPTLSVLFFGVLLYLLAHIFSYGAHLQEEVDGTI